MEIIRRDELQELLDVVRMKPYGKFLITGAAGSGKTFSADWYYHSLYNRSRTGV